MARSSWCAAALVIGLATVAGGASAQTKPSERVIEAVDSLSVGSYNGRPSIIVTGLFEGESASSRWHLSSAGTFASEVHHDYFVACERALRQTMARPGRYRVRLTLSSTSTDRLFYTNCALEARPVQP